MDMQATACGWAVCCTGDDVSGFEAIVDCTKTAEPLIKLKWKNVHSSAAGEQILSRLSECQDEILRGTKLQKNRTGTILWEDSMPA